MFAAKETSVSWQWARMNTENKLDKGWPRKMYTFATWPTIGKSKHFLWVTPCFKLSSHPVLWLFLMLPGQQVVSLFVNNSSLLLRWSSPQQKHNSWQVFWYPADNCVSHLFPAFVFVRISLSFPAHRWKQDFRDIRFFVYLFNSTFMPNNLFLVMMNF